MTNKLFRNIFILLFVTACFSGCIFEYPQPCEEVSNMRFFYLMNPENKDLFGESVNQVDVYIFDENGVYIDKKSDKGPHIQNNYNMPMNLPDGVYTFVVVGSKKSFFDIGVFDPNAASTKFDQGLITGKSTLENFRLKTTYTHNILFPLEIESLLRGNLIRRTINKNEQSILDVFMIQYRNNIRITIKGLDLTGYTPILYANNGRYDYENNIPADAQDKIYDAKVIKQNHEFQFDVLRLVERSTMQLMLVDQQQQMMPGFKPINLIKEIQKSPSYPTQEALDKEHFFDIELDFSKETQVAITINGWEIINTDPEI